MDDADAMGSQKYPRRRLNPRRVLLAALVCIVITVVLLQQLGICSSPPAEPSAASAMPGAGRASMASTRAPPPAWAAATHLIMVAGHAVLTASAQTDSNVQLESSWYLEPFQHGQLRTMLLHIRRGVEIAAADNSSLLVFSGGETRARAGPRSEALSYWEAADALGWFGTAAVRERTLLEVAARDSFENLLFAVCRFYEASGRYPERVTVVSFGFKRRRFVELHRAALRFPRSRFAFVGIDPPNLGVEVLRGELSHSSKPFERDPYGCADAALRAKRDGRNPFRRSSAAGYLESCPALAGLLVHCKPSLFEAALPWSRRLGDDDDDGVPRRGSVYQLRTS